MTKLDLSKHFQIVSIMRQQGQLGLSDAPDDVLLVLYDYDLTPEDPIDGKNPLTGQPYALRITGNDSTLLKYQKLMEGIIADANLKDSQTPDESGGGDSTDPVQ